MTVKTEIGEKVDDTFSFLRLRQQQVIAEKTLKFCPAEGRNLPIACQNQSDQTHTFLGCDIPARQLTVLVADCTQIAVRIRVDHCGEYVVVADFASVQNSCASVAAKVVVGGQELWRSSLPGRYAGRLLLNKEAAIDLSVHPAEAFAGYRAAGIKFAAFRRATDRDGALVRVDDDLSLLDTDIAEEWIGNWEAMPQVPVDNAGPIPASSQWVVQTMLSAWPRAAKYIPNQFRMSVDTLVALARNKRARPPECKYVIFFTPRSGSTMIAEVLGATGQLGFPIEYFVPENEQAPSILSTLKNMSYEEFIMTTLQTENGVFSIEVEVTRLQHEWVSSFFTPWQDWKSIYLTRSDILAQAVSYYFATHHDVWHRFVSDSEIRRDKFNYDRATIIGTINLLLDQEQSFESYFEQHRLAPYRMTYEAAMADAPAQFTGLASMLGVDGVDFGNVDLGQLDLRPTRDHQYELYGVLSMLYGGTFYGYDIFEIDGQVMAVLAGVDRGKIRLPEAREPAIIVATDHAALYRRIVDLIARKWAEIGRRLGLNQESRERL